MRLVEGVVLRLLDVVPELPRHLLRRRVADAAGDELVLQRRHQLVDLLADRLAQVVRLGRAEAADLLRDLHRLLLVDRDPVRPAGDLLQARVDEGDLLLPRLPLGVVRDVLHRPRPVERDERDQVLEDRRLHLAERLAHARGLELEDAHRLAAREHRVGLLVVERDRRHVDAADQLDRLVDHVEVAQAEEVHLQQAERLDRVHRELGHDLLVGALLLQRDRVDQRLGADHDAGGVDRVLADEPFERPRQVDDLLRRRIGLVGRLQVGAGLEAVGERLPRPFRDQLRDPVDDAVRDLEHPARVADGGAGGHRPEGDDLGDAVAPVLLGDVVDHPLAALDGEVDVDVRHRLAARVEEALEEQVVLDRVDVGDLERVGGERAGGRAAAGADADPVHLREVDEVPDDQEVVGEAHLADRLQLELEPLAQLRRHLVVAALQPLVAELDEVLERVPPVRGREPRQQDVAELDLDRAALGDLERAPHRVLVAGEVERHLRRRLEIELVRVEAPVIRVLERVARLNAKQGLVRVGVGGGQVVDVAGGDERQLRLGRELDELRVDPLLYLEARVLELDVGVVAPEHLRQPVEVGRRVLGPALLERLADAAGEAPGERDQPARIALEQLPVDARLRVVALEVAERAQLDQVRIAGVRLGQERQVRVAARARVAVVGDVDLAADDRLDPLVARRLVEVDRAGERAVVGERHRRHLELGRARRERRDPARPVEDRVLAVDVQVDEVGAHGGAIVRTGPDSLLRRCRRGKRRALLGPRKIGIRESGSRRARPLKCRARLWRALRPALEEGLEQAEVPAAQHGVVPQPAGVAPAGGLREQLAVGSLAHARHEPLREPLLLAACVERREVWVDPAIGHGCSRSPRGPSRSGRRRRSAGTTSRIRSRRSAPSASGRERRRRRGSAPSHRPRSGR